MWLIFELVLSSFALDTVHDDDDEKYRDMTIDSGRDDAADTDGNNGTRKFLSRLTVAGIPLQ